jgi:DNA-binding NarL/FixJ family response regulator
MLHNQSKIGVAIIDDQHLFRQSLAMLIQTVDELEFIADAANGKAFLDILPGIKEKVNVILVDLDMPVMNGVELNRIIQQEHPEIKVVILSVHAEDRILAQMIDAGASAYLAKNCDKDELILAIQTVYKAGYYMNPATIKALQNSSHIKNMHRQPNNIDESQLLTPREKQVLYLICQEFTNAEIAKKLYISTRTVEGHRNNLLDKTGCHSTAGLAIFAVKHKIFEV